MVKYPKLVNSNICDYFEPFTIFCESLKQALQSQLKGEISVQYISETDTIKVCIKHGIMCFKYDIEHACNHVLTIGANSYSLIIVNLYKKVLYKRISTIYFRENGDNS